MNGSRAAKAATGAPDAPGARFQAFSWLSSPPLRVLLVFKVLYLLLVAAAVLLWPTGKEAEIFHSQRQAWTPRGYLTFESHFTSWDAEHYLHLTEAGYERGAPACAFYPLWPLLIRWASVLTGGNHVVAGMILANIISLGAFLLFFCQVRTRLGAPTAWLALLFLLAFPGSLFFQFIYTEGLFFLLLVLLWLGLERGWPWLSAGAAFLLPLTRAVGVLCLVPILWDLLFRAAVLRRPKEAGGYRWVFPCRLDWRQGVLLAAPLCGWGLYFLLMQVWTGNAFEGFRAQKHWGVQSIGNLFDLPKFVTGFLNPTSIHEFVGSGLDRAVFLLFVYCLPLIWRLDKGWFVWAVVLGIVPAMSGTFCSFTRFASVLFPLPIALAVFFGTRERRVPRLLVVVLFIALHVVLVWRFVNYRWAG